MFVTSDPEDISDHFTLNTTIREGIPRQYSSLSHNEYSDWEIPPWELLYLKIMFLGKVLLERYILLNGEKHLLLLK